MLPKIFPGQPFPLGASYDGAGTNFSIFSEVADKVELCLFDEVGKETRITLPEMTGFCWHGYMPGMGPGQRYGFRVFGPWEPKQGHRCNPAKLLLDPYAKAIEGQVQWNPAVFPYTLGNPEGPPSKTDSAPFVPKAVVSQPFFEWGEDRQPRIPWHETVIYEVHVKGFSALNPEIPPEQRGTFAGLAHPASMEYLTRLGVTAIELMPVHQFVHDARLVESGLRNYWGYNSIGYLAPHNEYSATRHPETQLGEFKQMVVTMHRAGIEVILDVVYNHTAEGNHLGPMLCMKGIDNAAYYRLDQEDPRYYVDYTGTGNSMNMRHPHVLQLVMDSLRYWVLEMHVDGFRFDLAATLARELHDVDRLSAFLDLIQQDPVISQVKLIAEPWDVGEGGYQVGNFPPLWSEWNGQYRDCVRDFWRGEDQTLGEFAQRFTGSPDLYENTGRRPYASINFVTAHDGFTLADLVAYNEKHNEANGEDNQDGESHNRSWNCGVEGPTDDLEILKLRARQKRNFLATLLLSQGVPMLVGGDELGRTQKGNNNAYCHDSKLSWIDWEKIDEGLLDLTRNLVELRVKHPVFHRRRWFQGTPLHGSATHDIEWFTFDGKNMKEENWNHDYAKSLGIYLNGEGLASPNARGDRIVDDTFYLLFNAYHDSLPFKLPARKWGKAWVKVLDTAEEEFDNGGQPHAALGAIPVEGRSIVVLRRAEED